MQKAEPKDQCVGSAPQVTLADNQGWEPRLPPVPVENSWAVGLTHNGDFEKEGKKVTEKKSQMAK